jgi:phage shock protein PspC (stress-responsive transcriptional regulator)
MAVHDAAQQAGGMNTTQSQSEPHLEAETPGGAGHDGQPGSQFGSGQPGGQFGSGLPRLAELRRPVGDRMIAGVASGVARYLGVDPNLVRIVFVVLAFAGGAALPLYVAGWLLIPEEGAEQSIAGELFSSLENRPR